MIYIIKPENHEIPELTKVLEEHPEIQFVSFMGVDIGGNGTDEKIPVKLFIKDMKEMLKFGIQTDGSSVELQGIADLNDARVDILPDLDCNWFVDYNYEHYNDENGLPVGTLKIPSFIIHGGKQVCSRSILKRATNYFKTQILEVLKKNSRIPESFGFEYEDIEDVLLTSATELEMWVKTPEQSADFEELHTSQVLKEQYWKRTMGTVRTVIEKIMEMLERYDLKPEMAHKEVGGIPNRIDAKGRITHVMEQLEIDWRFSESLQTADNEIFIRELIEDQFRHHGLEVLFKAKPIEGVAGNGEHTHLGVAVKLKSGKRINLFAPKDIRKDYLSEIGYGSLMGVLKNYEVINPIVTATNDAFNRLKPGFEAPVCIVTSLGGTKEQPSRNRSVLVGVIRDINNPGAIRFELRSPNPYTNTYLVIAAAYQAMLDGIIKVTDAGLSCEELEKEISKKYGEDAVYLEKFREYRSEKDVFEKYTEEERNKLYGTAPATVWENLSGFKSNSLKEQVLKSGDVFTDELINSFKESTLQKWKNELRGRIIHDNIMLLKTFVKLHNEHDHATDLDVVNWERIVYLKTKLMKDSMSKKCIFTKIKNALNEGDYDSSSDLQKQMNEKMTEIRALYIEYKNNIF
ncbi:MULTISPECIES: glutamine synthetase [unclassified Sedimentibacter]|uniref:glutamine synthetase n=1 Tax=unclassified Sedimentibacter TaxID=2649220 RepID=UPI0027E0823F|nr:glutamine synthetase [Sedimentibacter sp. MB35-C1]WMJ77248.1 glutamine synthetase [Sedimentibacter sp. MB35-C1]